MTENLTNEFYRIYARRLTNDKKDYEGNGRFMAMDVTKDLLVTRIKHASKFNSKNDAINLSKRYQKSNNDYEVIVRKVYADGNTINV